MGKSGSLRLAAKVAIGDDEVAQEEWLPLNELACANAAAYGQLEALMWLRSEGCHWDERTCAGAAAGGHLDVLKYAHENGCPWYE